MAQLVAHLLCKQGVRGSSPLGSTAGQRPFPLVGQGLFRVRTPEKYCSRAMAGDPATLGTGRSAHLGEACIRGALSAMVPHDSHPDSSPPRRFSASRVEFE